LEGNPNNPRDFHNPKLAMLRMRECDQLDEYLKSIGIETTWWDRVKLGEQDPWEKLRANDPNNQMRQFKMRVE
jgi:hypothetical protein